MILKKKDKEKNFLEILLGGKLLLIFSEIMFALSMILGYLSVEEGAFSFRLL